MSYIPRLKTEYKDRITTRLTEEFGYSNIMQVPKLEKIVLSRGVGAAVADKKLVDHAVDELTMISGQKALSTLSKKDVASFKLRKGMPIGAKVTLRGDKMYEFFDRLVTAALPRVRDFQGVKADGFDAFSDYIRVGVKSGGCSGLSYDLKFDNLMSVEDKVYEDNEVKIIVDNKSFLYLIGTTLEFSGGLNGKGFVFNNPNASRTCGCGESFSL